ncbi:hypothetical protein M378DRAFT_15585 [Amanita muscaria Koide BX008]|uniref:Uncharacterized protein n=1 Tax=Amanita muscaria (strain Koide BX008) TaxID=946122 RepID=A0A0C2WAW7_AMAMK|nr:hypothetical protein M378DRAFT_18769 [Amanita muscaria Koide BX008]KIL58402.1 hypothetical protein M378DRAFT_15585 [Amanita muscaria Koide BX008]
MPPKRITMRMRGLSTAPLVASTSAAPLHTTGVQGVSPGTSPLSSDNRSHSSPGITADVAALSAALELGDSQMETATSPAPQSRSPCASMQNLLWAGSVLGSQEAHDSTSTLASSQNTLTVCPSICRSRKGKEKAQNPSQTQCSPIAELEDDAAITHIPTGSPAERQQPPRTPVRASPALHPPSVLQTRTHTMTSYVYSYTIR